MRKKRSEQPLEHFWNNVARTETCWNWTAGLTYKGYGFLTLDRKQFRAHRYSYELHNGPIPKGMLICHRCDNRRCVRPDHLFLGTTQDNTADRHNKGRTLVIRGENHWRSRVDEKAVRDMRSRRLRLAEFASLYDLTKESVRAIQRRKSWKHVV